MLLKVLNENYEVRFMDYGTIEIPKGTRVDDKEYENPHTTHCPVNEFDWIDDRYPGQSQKMKAEAIAHGIAIPKEMLVKALRVRFVYGDSGYCRN